MAVIQRTVDASERQGDAATAVEGLRCLLQLQPDDAARLHYRMAVQLRERSPEEARRAVLQALEQAPRYREALRLLRELPTSQPVERPVQPVEAAAEAVEAAPVGNAAP
jgi:tetratricopeptide (TPR) repeat protein